MASKIGKFLEAVQAGTADEGAAMTLWQAISRGRKVQIDLADPEPGWKIVVEEIPNTSRDVTVTAVGKPAKRTGHP
jgi:hypothetical protein